MQMEHHGLDLIHEVAEAQDGYFSTAQAENVGISRHTLAKATARGKLLRTSRGVYRLAKFPELSSNSHLWAAVLWPQARTQVSAILSHHTALLLHDLSDVNVEQVHIIIPRAIRIVRAIPNSLVLHHANLLKHDVIHIDGLPVTTIERTLRDIASLGETTLLHDALRDARARNLAIPSEFMHV